MPRRIQSTPWQPFAAYNVCAARACHWCSYLNCTLHAYCCQALSRTRFDPHVAYPSHTHETLSSLVCRHTPMFTVSSLVRIAIVADALRSLLSVLRTSRMLPLALFSVAWPQVGTIFRLWASRLCRTAWCPGAPRTRMSTCQLISRMV